VSWAGRCPGGLCEPADVVAEQVDDGHRIDLFGAAAGTSQAVHQVAAMERPDGAARPGCKRLRPGPGVDQERAPTLIDQEPADGSGELTVSRVRVPGP
jgi:hypothetical protein